MLPKDLLDIDHKHIWHPYSSAINPLQCLAIEKAEGAKIKCYSGEWLVDGMSSWWSVIHGYNHPKLNEAIQEQLTQMAHVMFGGLTHKPAIALTQSLLAVVPDGLSRVFYSDSGSVAVEVAMKMAMQYQQAKGNVTKVKFLSLKGGYHGDTWHAMSVCDPQTGMHQLYQEQLTKQFFAPRPNSRFNGAYDLADLVSVENILATNHKHIAAFILEPIVQGAGGMWFYHPDFLKDVVKLCKAYDVLVIADEIATGFGRTGELFACNHAGVTPDILCLGKALTGGYMSFAATLCTEAVAETISKGKPGVLMHGPTFMANPLGCAVAQASLQLLATTPWKEQVFDIAAYFKTHLMPFKTLGFVKDVRVLGAIGVVELYEPIDMANFQKLLIDYGVWIRPFGTLVYLMPPFIIDNEELKQLVDGMKAILTRVCGNFNI